MRKIKNIVLILVDLQRKYLHTEIFEIKFHRNDDKMKKKTHSNLHYGIQMLCLSISYFPV